MLADTTQFVGMKRKLSFDASNQIPSAKRHKPRRNFWRMLRLLTLVTMILRPVQDNIFSPSDDVPVYVEGPTLVTPTNTPMANDGDLDDEENGEQSSDDSLQRVPDASTKPTAYSLPVNEPYPALHENDGMEWLFTAGASNAHMDDQILKEVFENISMSAPQSPSDDSLLWVNPLEYIYNANVTEAKTGSASRSDMMVPSDDELSMIFGAPSVHTHSTPASPQQGEYDAEDCEYAIPRACGSGSVSTMIKRAIPAAPMMMEMEPATCDSPSWDQCASEAGSTLNAGELVPCTICKRHTSPEQTHTHDQTKVDFVAPAGLSVCRDPGSMDCLAEGVQVSNITHVGYAVGAPRKQAEIVKEAPDDRAFITVYQLRTGHGGSALKIWHCEQCQKSFFGKPSVRTDVGRHLHLHDTGKITETRVVHRPRQALPEAAGAHAGKPMPSSLRHMFAHAK